MFSVFEWVVLALLIIDIILSIRNNARIQNLEQEQQEINRTLIILEKKTKDLVAE